MVVLVGVLAPAISWLRTNEELNVELGALVEPRTPEGHACPKLLGPKSASIKIVTGELTLFSQVVAARMKAAFAAALFSRLVVARKMIVRCVTALSACALNPTGLSSRWLICCRFLGLIFSRSSRSAAVATRQTVSPFGAA